VPGMTYVPATPGGWAVMRSSALTVAIDVSQAHVDVDGLWNLMSQGSTVEQALDFIIIKGLRSAPSFAVIGEGSPGSFTFLVRGPIEVLVETSSDSRRLSGTGVSTWVEQQIDDVASVSCSLAVATAEPAPRAFPLDSGIAWASGFALGVASVVPSASTTMITPVAELPPAIEPVVVPEPVAVPEPVVVPEPVAVSEPLAIPDAPLAMPEELTQVPAMTMTVPPPPPPAAPRAAETQAAETPAAETPAAEAGYDYLFGETVFRKVEDAAVRADETEVESPQRISAPPASPDDASREPTDAADGDHDGHTVMVSDIAALRAQRRAARAGAPAIPSAPRLYLDLSTGGREFLDQTLVIGRAPAASRVSGGSVPRLVSMNTPNQDISRTHAQVSAEGGTVVVTDLHSSNGTLITLPGRPPQKLRQGEPTAVIVGTVIDLGDGATLTVGEER
jgi:FHA domain